MEQSGIHGEEAPGWQPVEPDHDPAVPADRLALSWRALAKSIDALTWPTNAAGPTNAAELTDALTGPTNALTGLTNAAGPTNALTGPTKALTEPTVELPVVVPVVLPVRRGPRRIAVTASAGFLLLIAVLIMRTGDGPSAERAAAREASSAGSWAPAVAHPAAATFEVGDGVADIRLSTADLGTDLYRVSAPGARPQVTVADGKVRLNVVARAGQVEVALAADVRWDLRVGGGVGHSTIDLSGARLHNVELTGGADRIDLTLPRPDGTLTVRMTGGVNRFDVHTVGHVPVRVRVGSGAGRVVLDGHSHDRVAAGALFTTDEWATAVDRIDVDAVAGMSALTVTAS